MAVVPLGANSPTARNSRSLNQDEDRPSDTPLESRHIFLDTEVYHSLGHNPAHPAMEVLKKHVASHRIRPPHYRHHSA
jgi:hypothetical protein